MGLNVAGLGERVDGGGDFGSTDPLILLWVLESGGRWDGESFRCSDRGDRRCLPARCQVVLPLDIAREALHMLF